MVRLMDCSSRPQPAGLGKRRSTLLPKCFWRLSPASRTILASTATALGAVLLLSVRESVLGGGSVLPAGLAYSGGSRPMMYGGGGGGGYGGGGYGGGGYGGGYGGGGGTEMVMPPVVWLFQDYDLAFQACPVLLGICGAVVIGFIFQHCFNRCIPFVRITIFYPPTLKAGEFWRLLTHVLLHNDMGHLFCNLLHVLNTLDLEGVAAGSGYPGGYAIGSHHTLGVAATTAAFGALAGSVPFFGAMYEGASAMTFGLDGALLAACGLLMGSGAADPSLQSFLQTRGFFAAMHMGIDILRGCSNPRGTVGNFSHLMGFLGGFCYILAVLPAIGGRPVPTFPCLRQSGTGWGQEQCIALFTVRYSWPVQQACNVATAVLAAGPALALLNAFLFRRAHASADGYSVFVKMPQGGGGGGGGRPQSDDAAMQAALARSMQER